MDKNIDSTAIIRSLKDLNKFISQDNRNEDCVGGQKFNLKSPYSSDSRSPKMKLNFSDSLNNTFLDSVNSSNETYLQRHQESIAGFDITKKIREKDCEIIDAKTNASILESKLQNVQSSYKKRKLELESEIDTFRKKELRDKELIDDLEYKIKELQMREKDTKEEAMRIQKTAEAKCTIAEKKMLQLHSENLERSNKYHEELGQLRRNLMELEKQVKEKSSSVDILETTNKELDERCSSLYKKLIKLEQTQLDMENLRLKLSKAEIKNKELELNLEKFKKQEEQQELFEKSLQRLKVFEKENKKLKEENNTHQLIGLNVGLLEEKLSATEGQIRRLENRCLELTAENGTLNTMREINEKYESALVKELELDYLPPVSELIQHIQSLKKRDTEASNTLSELKESLKSHDSTRLSKDEMVQKLQKEVEIYSNEVVKKDQLIRRFQRKIVLVSKERDSLKGIISSYESESTILPSQLEQEKIAKLESVLKDYKAEIGKLEDDIETAMSGNIVSQRKHVVSESPELSEKLKNYEKMIATLTEEKKVLEVKLEQQNINQGFDPANTKILHFKENPLEKANREGKKEFERLQEENETLKKRVKLMEEGENQDLTLKVGAKVNTATTKQVQELEEKVNSLETRNQRIVEVFNEKAKKFREAVYQLTGYRVDLRGDTHYKLLNIYSESRDDYILFENTTDGFMNLLETDFSATLHHLIKPYLHERSSYPAFLSAVTLELYNRQTMVQSDRSSGEEEEEEYEGGEEEDLEGGEVNEREEEEDLEGGEMDEREDEEDYEGGEMEEEDEEDYEGGEEMAEEYDDDEEEEEEDYEGETKMNNKDDDDDDDLICID